MKLEDVRLLFRKELGDIYSTQTIEYYFKAICDWLYMWDPVYIALNLDKELTIKQEKKFLETIDVLTRHKPLQYITGEAQFLGRTYHVDDTVMIPRPETEQLVEWVLLETLNLPNRTSVLEIGTGSGCVAISLVLNNDILDVHAIEKYPDTLKLAKKNASKFETNIKFYLADIASLKTLKHGKLFDVIVSNPPYVTPSECSQMENNVLDWEPHEALFVPQKNPLKYYRHILDFAVCNLRTCGIIYFEINPLFKKQIRDLLLEKGYHSVEFKKDKFARVRMVKAIKSNTIERFRGRSMVS